MQEKTRICNWGSFNFPSTCFCFLRSCFEFLQKVFLGLMYPFSCVLWAIFWSFSCIRFRVCFGRFFGPFRSCSSSDSPLSSSSQKRKMPQKLIPNHRTINPKQLLNYILSQQQITSSDVRLRILQRMDYMFVLKCMSDNNQYIPLKNEYILHPRLNIYCIRD